VLDTYKAERATIDQHAEYIKKHRLARAEATFCDPAGRNKNDQTGRSDVDEFERAGIPCRYTTAARWHEVANGIQLVRSLLNPNKPQIYVIRNEGNRAFIADIESYANRKVNGIYIDDPIKPQPADHTMDGLRYFCVNRMAGYSAGIVKLGAA
ncbi:unnamed protein product, partial [marine sediment metagenome]